MDKKAFGVRLDAAESITLYLPRQVDVAVQAGSQQAHAREDASYPKSDLLLDGGLLERAAGCDVRSELVEEVDDLVRFSE